MRILYPFNPLNPNEADEPYQEEFSIMNERGIKCSLFDFDNLGEFRAKPRIENGSGSRYLLQLVLGVQAQSSRKLRDGLCSNGFGHPAPISSSPQQGGLNIAAMTTRDLVATCIFTPQAA